MSERPSRRRRTADLLSRLERIRESEDRRHGPALAEALARGEIGEEHVAEVAETLVVLEDPRCAAALVGAVHDTKLDGMVRAAAIEILSATPADDPEPDTALAWAQSHDPFVRALGVQYLDVEGGDLVAAATGAPEPVVRRIAVESMASLVRTPALVAALRAALRDDDAFVREIACRVALFDEPLECSWELLRALSDPSAVVRAAAFDALEWFPRVSVLLALADARSTSNDGDAAEIVLGVLARRVVAAFDEASPGARRRLERWAGPVGWLIVPAAALPDATASAAAAGGAPEEGAGGRPGDGPARIDVDEAAAALPNPDAPPSVQREMLTRRSWAKSGRRGRDVLRACAAGPNWALRQMSARPLLETGLIDELAALACDREAVVRRAAFVAVLERSDVDDPRFLAAAHASLDDPRVRPTVGDHALAIVAAHGRPADLEDAVLDELARSDDRDGLFLGAIQLARLAAVRRAVPALLAIVNAPIVAGVGVHVAALQALRSLGHPRSRIDLRHLDGVDHLDVQRELGEWGWHGARWG